MDNLQPQHTNRQYEEELRAVRGDLLKMGGLVERQIAEAMEALVNRDTARRARSSRATPKSTGSISRPTSSASVCSRCISRPPATCASSPPGSKITTDLERIGDNAVNICERVLELNEEPQLKPYIDMPRMAAAAQSMVKDSLDAFLRDDVELAEEVIERDDEVDQLNYQMYRELLCYMAEDPHTIGRATRLLFISKYLERIADHATNIAEMVVFMVKGTTIRHMDKKKHE